MCIDEKEAGILIQKVDMLEEKAEKAEEIFFNNGLIERVARIEENIIFILENSRLNTSINNTILDKIETLDNTFLNKVETLDNTFKCHILNKELHSFKGLILNRNTIVWVVLGMTFIHSILPKELDLWELIKKLLGF